MCEIKEEVQSWENNDTNYKTSKYRQNLHPI